MLLKLMKTFAFYIDFYLHIQGGALYIDGKNNKIYQCYFAGNSAPVGRGGAIYFDSGEIKETDGSANTAAQCNDIYLATAGSCGLWDPANY